MIPHLGLAEEAVCRHTSLVVAEASFGNVLDEVQDRSRSLRLESEIRKVRKILAVENGLVSQATGRILPQAAVVKYYY